MELNHLPSQEWVRLGDSVPKTRQGMVQRVTVQWRSLADTTVTRWWLKSPVISCGITYPWWLKKGTSPLWYSFPKLITPVNHVKNNRPTHSTEYLASAPWDCQGHGKNKERLRNHNISEKAEKTWQLNAVWMPGLDPEREGGH